MGTRQSKIEGSYLPETPTGQQMPLQGINRIEQMPLSSNDPRSPSGLRTPISVSRKLYYL